jgi:hypothetical protein
VEFGGGSAMPVPPNLPAKLTCNHMYCVTSKRRPEQGNEQKINKSGDNKRSKGNNEEGKEETNGHRHITEFLCHKQRCE